MRLGLLFCMVSLTVGCSQIPTKPDASSATAIPGTAPAAAVNADQVAAPAAVASVAAATPAPAPAPVVVANTPVLIDFIGTGNQLGDAAKAAISAALVQAKNAKKIEVHGSCDRVHTANAKAVALARAVKVKEQLVKEGVPASKIHLRYSTDKPDNNVEIIFE